MYYMKYQSKLAPIILVGDDSGLKRLYFDVPQAKEKLEISTLWVEDNDFFADVTMQLDEYFAGARKEFDIRLNLIGSYYQKKIWELLKEIPYGQTRTYKEIAERSGDPNASRAVGGANGKNPIPLIIPCHRVVGANEKLTGYAFGTELKQKLIQLENDNI